MGDGGDRIVMFSLPPTLPTPPTPPTPVDSSSQMPLEEIWQQVVESLSLPLSKALFKEHGHLLSINNDTCEVTMPEKLVVIAQGKLADVEAAFLKVCQRKVKVNFVSKKFKSAPVNESKEAPKNLTPPPPQPFTPTHNHQIPPTSEVTKPAKITPTKTEPVKHTATMQTPQAPKDWELDEVAIAAQRLAQFFDGAVIRFTDDPGSINPLSTSEWAEEAEGDDEEF